MSGRLVAAPVMGGDYGFDVAELTPGIYIARIDDSTSGISHKLQFVKSQ